jgi:hypothetical protein
MTLPYERVNAVQNTRKFLLSLLVPSMTPKVPSAVRTQARRLLKHYPWDMEAEALAHTEHLFDIKHTEQNKPRSGRRGTKKERKP